MWILDTAFPVTFIHQHGIETEANPIIIWIVNSCGIIGFYFLKFATWGFLILANFLYYLKYNKPFTYLLELFLSIALFPAVHLGFLIVR